MDIKEEVILQPIAPVPGMAKVPANMRERIKAKRRVWFRTPEGRRWRRRQAKRLKIRNATMPERMTNAGIMWGETRETAAAAWEESLEKAKRTMAELIVSETIQVPKTTDENAAYDALECALTIMRSKVAPREQLAAAKIVLDFTKAKPAQKQDITVSSTETWLKQVIEDDKSNGSGPA